MMKGKLMTGLLMAILASSGFAHDSSLASTETLAEGPPYEIDCEKISKSYGNLFGRTLDIPGFELDLEALIQGIRDSQNGIEPPLSEEEFEGVMAYLHEKAFLDTAEKNLQAAQDFLAENQKKDGMIVLEDGLVQYEVLATGSDSDCVGPESSPSIHFVGKFLDDVIFASSESDMPISITLSQTIPGIQAGLDGAKNGEIRRIYIHPERGYGAGNHLPPNSLLVFEIEVLEANPENQTAAEAKV